MENPAGLATIIHRLSQPDDLVVCLGAGSITSWANALPDELRALDSAKIKAAT
jgi:UDP-N-acetylmuramate--alanine ligase